MSSCRDGWRGALLAVALAGAAGAAQPQDAYPGIGRAATPAELRAWDIDVRPDLKGLPPGSGSVERGQLIWEAQCAACHGVFGEANHVFSPLVGGTTAQDVQAGRVARLTDSSFPSRTTLMKLPTVSTLWDYIHRAMPWAAPKSLSPDEVYAVTAYMLHLGGIVPAGFVLTPVTMREVQQRLPNRRGMSIDHVLWPGQPTARQRRPDVRARACMTNCAGPAQVVSTLPDYARDQHGNLAEQQRLVGPQRGAVTAAPAAAASGPAGAARLARQHQCTACHGQDERIVGPAFREIAARYAGRGDAAEYLAVRIRAGGSGNWGNIAMPMQTLPDADITRIARWLADGATP